MPQTIVPPPQVEWFQDICYPPPRWNQAAAGPTSSIADRRSGYEVAGLVTVTGTPINLFFDGAYATRLGGTAAAGANENQQLAVGVASHVNLAKLPAGVVMAEIRRMFWWSFRMRLLSPSATFGLRFGIGLIGNQLGTTWFANDTPPTIGHGLGISGDGAGGLRFHRKVSAAANAGLSESVNLVWPRALTAWTEVWFVILSATAGGAARFQLYIDRLLVLERAWPDDGVTGSLNPILESGATAFMFFANGAGLLHPGMRMYFTDLRLRQGQFFVDGSPLSGT